MKVRGALLAAALATGISMLAPAAFAQGAVLQDKITVDLVGTVSQAITFGTGADQVLEAADLTASHSATVTLPLSANTPFRIGIASTNGALKSLATPDRSGFAFEKAYTVGLKINTDGGQIAPPDCASGTLKAGTGGCSFFGAAAGAGVSSGKDVALNKTAQVTVSWTSSTGNEPRLAAGDYQDTLIITVGAAT